MEAAETCCKFIVFSQVVFPYTPNVPARQAQLAPIFGIAKSCSSNLLLPPRVAIPSEIMAAGAAMPETAVNED